MAAMQPRFKFGNEGTFSVTINNPMTHTPKTQPGHYEVTASDAHSVTMRTTDDHGTKTSTAIFTDPTHMVLTAQGKPGFPLQRAQ